ncbi:ENKUR protein, partial [Eurystomus gularis]|nr:ENKUR protein [Eurystomus gularis]
PRYISKFRPSVKREAEKNKAQCKTMGPAKVALPSPEDFLRKHSKEPKLPERKKEHDRKKVPALSVPQSTEHPVMGIQSKKNFIKANALAVIRALPKNPQPSCVDRRQGDKYLLETTGLVPKYVKKKDYGVVPKYITQRKEEMRAQKETSALEHLEKNAMKRLSDEERRSLLQGLKKNWDELNCEFQHLLVPVGTLRRKLYKEKLDAQMKELEHDIELIESHKDIYIANE